MRTVVSTGSAATAVSFTVPVDEVDDDTDGSPYTHGFATIMEDVACGALHLENPAMPEIPEPENLHAQA